LAKTIRRKRSSLETKNMPFYQPTWTTERVEHLKAHFAAGLSCREIADQIGVSRNAVIGKVSRLNLTREKTRAARPARKEAASTPRSRAIAGLRLRLVKARSDEPPPVADHEPIHNGHCCSLFELNRETCRWPINTPGEADFCFCGNPPIEGLPYCAGHSRLAYRIGSR
jgi:GcrA cell cycle regulator